MRDLDWSYVRSFLAVAETGSLSAAARKLGISQPTIGRHVKAAEKIVKGALFTRHLRGLALTPLGQSLLDPAKAMAASAVELMSKAETQDLDPTGTVRITASKVVSHYLLPPVIARLRRQEPQIQIELVPSDTVENLTFREADIAIRMFRPTQLEVVSRHVCDLKMALYGAHSLFERYGDPVNAETILNMPFVGFDREDFLIRWMGKLGIEVEPSFFVVRCDDQAVFWQLVCEGCGVGAMQEAIGDRDPRVRKMEFQPELPRLPLWLAASEDLRKSNKIERVWNFLASELDRETRLRVDF